MSEVATLAPHSQSLVARVATRFGVEPEKLLTTLKTTCFRSDKPISNEQMMGLLIVAQQYNLNPFTKELFAFDDRRGGIIPYVSVDGWSRIINEHPHFDGVDFAWDEHQQSITCTIYRKDRSHPTVITEYMVECKRATDPWNKTPRRMLRHKAFMQCGRIAFGFAGIYDVDEAERIRDASVIEAAPASTQRKHLRHVLAAARETVPVLDDDPPMATLDELSIEMLGCLDRDQATEVLDRGRSLLSDDEFATLAATYASNFKDEESP